jgi:hypothetical protein
MLIGIIKFCIKKGKDILIKFSEIEVCNFRGALRGMRNPLESWKKSDSKIIWDEHDEEWIYSIGEKDLELALNLIKAGNDHSKFMRQIFVCMDIYAPEYWWKEYETYQVGTTENSTSTMHKITSRLLTENDFSIDTWDGEDIGMLNNINELIWQYQQNPDKTVWRKIIQKLPMTFNYLRTCTMNYQVLRNMYFARRNHRLQEWKDFCTMIEGLPYSNLITVEK